MELPGRVGRRQFMGTLAGVGAAATLGSIAIPENVYAVPSQENPEALPELGGRPLAQFPEKAPLLLLTDRPPQLETPLHYFLYDLTPNEAFFVRWHLSGIPTSVNADTFRIDVGGLVRQPLSLSVQELKSKFDPFSIIAVNQCSGNARSLFEPRVPGGQWTQGAMGNALWKGVRLKDVLDRAGVAANATEVYFRGLDQPALQVTPFFQKSLALDHARDGEVMIAYEMNGAPLPMLNGFPIRLIVPGWYATYWVKSLSSVHVADGPLKSFWMEKAYRIPANPEADEAPGHLAQETEPINRMAVHSIFVRPGRDEKLLAGRSFRLQGLAVHDGSSEISKVEVSTDAGKNWSNAILDPSLGKYSWRRWRMDWTPPAPGEYRLIVRATNAAGEGQPAEQWNRSGYQRSVMEHDNVVVL